jgi:hypothetical protein
MADVHVDVRVAAGEAQPGLSVDGVFVEVARLLEHVEAVAEIPRAVSGEVTVVRR